MIKKVMIPAGFLAVVIAAVVVYMGLHRNKEAATQINYSGIKDINLENVSPDYWNTDSVHRVAAAEDGYYYITDEDMLIYINPVRTVLILQMKICLCMLIWIVKRKFLSVQDQTVHIIQQIVMPVLEGASYTAFIIIMADYIICR